MTGNRRKGKATPAALQKLADDVDAAKKKADSTRKSLQKLMANIETPQDKIDEMNRKAEKADRAYSLAVEKYREAHQPEAATMPGN